MDVGRMIGRVGRTTSLLGLMMFACSFARVAVAQEDAGFTQNALAGSQVFGSKGCVKCHVCGYSECG